VFSRVELDRNNQHVSGFLHQPEQPTGRGMVLTHGAGANATAPLLVAIAEAFCATGTWVLRCNLAFRQSRPFGPPSPATGPADRASLAAAIAVLREHAAGPIFLGGHSYGGRQASMLAAEQPEIADSLLLLSYPLHPPNKPAQLRTAHFPSLRTPALFVHGTKDPFASIEELRTSIALIPASTQLIQIEGAGHDLAPVKTKAAALVEAAASFFNRLI
jgi:predicted alpha/beta-hydrolase family hydrolase